MQKNRQTKSLRGLQTVNRIDRAVASRKLDPGNLRVAPMGVQTGTRRGVGEAKKGRSHQETPESRRSNRVSLGKNQPSLRETKQKQ